MWFSCACHLLRGLGRPCSPGWRTCARSAEFLISLRLRLWDPGCPQRAITFWRRSCRCRQTRAHSHAAALGSRSTDIGGATMSVLDLEYNFASLSLRDLLEARDTYHYHLLSKANV